MERFWLIWEPSTGKTHVKHYSYQQATNEAERLARLHKGKQFVVLESISQCFVKDVIWENAEQVLPF